MRLPKFNKYRNAVATVSKREEWYSELSLDTDVSTGSNGLALDDRSIYVKTASGNSLQAIDIAQPGKIGAQTKTLERGSPGRLTDWTTSMCDESTVAAADDCGVVSLWRTSSLQLTWDAHDTSCTNTCFHPTVGSMIATIGNDSGGVMKLWDLGNANASEIASWEPPARFGAIDSLSFKGDGGLVAISTHDGTACSIYDLRQGTKPSISTTPQYYASGRPTRVQWLSDSWNILTTGLTKMRERSPALWDQRNLSKPLASSLLQVSTKPPIPIYDEDTHVAYLFEKGDSAIRWIDTDPSSANPLAELGSISLPSPIAGCALLPKRKLDVMKGEIARAHVVVESQSIGVGTAVIPISYVAPRRSYLDFHKDLFPDTRAPLSTQTYAAWLAEEPFQVPKMSLDPSKTKDSPQALRKVFGSFKDVVIDAKAELTLTSTATSPAPSLEAKAEADVGKLAISTEQQKPKLPSQASENNVATTTEQLRKRNVRQPVADSKNPRFKYIEGYTYPPNKHFIGLPAINLGFPSENGRIRISSKYIAVASAGTGGQVGILRHDSPGRAPAMIAKIVHGADVVCMEFDPFDPAVLATAGSDCILQMWRVPDTATLGEEASFELVEYIHVTADRIHQIHFHPGAKGVVAVLASEAGEYSVYVYNGLMLHFIIGKTDEGIHSFAWSPDGENIALTTKKSKQLRVYNVRTQELVGSGLSMDSIRPCGIAWLNDHQVVLTGFGIGSQREASLHNVSDLSKPVAKKIIDVGPGILTPIVDCDCNIIYLDDHGSRLTHAFEVVGSKQLVELPKYESALPSLGMAALPKKYVDVRRSELLLGYRLNAQAIEPIGFRVPRKRPEYFQDDIYPDTIDWETPSVDAMAWVSGTKASPKEIDLCPPDMTPLSDAPPEIVRRPIYTTQQEEKPDNTKQAIDSMLGRVDSSSASSNNDSGDSGSEWDD